ncbi:MAG TPA: hypothetical protein VIZ65_02410 [Cellvibrionaceae bacterium]
MNKQPYFIAGWLLALASLVVVLAFPLLPARHWNLTAQTAFNRFLITDQNKGGQTEAAWLDAGKTHYTCKIQPATENPFCAMQISLSDRPGHGYNLSGYDRLRIKLRYQGPSSVLRIHTRVFDDRFSTPSIPETAKFQSYVLTPNPQGDSIELPLRGFSVADWWVREYAPRREYAQVDFANVLVLGIDIPAPTLPGTYDIQLEELEFIGAWVSFEQVLASLILLWCALVTTFLVVSCWTVHCQWRRERPAWQELQLSLGGYKPTADFRPYNNFRDRATQCLDHTGLVLALVELLQQSIRPRLPFVVIELVASPSAGEFTPQVLTHDVQVEFAERLKRYTKDDIGVVARWRGPCFIVLGTTTREHLMVRLDLLRAALSLNPLMHEGQPIATDVIIASGILGDLEQAFDQLLNCWWRVHWRKRTGLVGLKPVGGNG